MFTENFSMVVLLLLGCANIAFWGMLLMHKQKSMDQHHIAMFIFGTGMLVLAYFFLIVSEMTWMKIALMKFQYITGLIAGMAWLGYIYQVTQFNSATDRKRMFLPVFFYVASVAILLTNEWHGLIWKSITLRPLWSRQTLTFEYNVGFWVLVAGMAAGVLLGLYWVLYPKKKVEAEQRTWQILLATTLLIPLAFGVFDLWWDASITVTPYAFGVCGIMLGAIAMMRLSRNILPIAHETIIHGMEDGVIVLSLEGAVIEINEKAQTILNLSSSDALGKRLSELIPLTEDEDSDSPSWMARKSELRFSIDGEDHYFDLRSSTLKKEGSDVGRVLVMRDITNWKRVTSALKESEASYRNLFERVPVGLYRSTPNREILDVNQALVEILGYSDRDTLLQVKTGEMYADPRDYEAWVKQMETRGVLRDHELHLRRYDGSDIWLRENVIAVRDDHGDIKHFEGSLEDITGTKLTMLALEQERNFTETVLDTVGALVVVLDRKGRIVRFNRSCERLTGFLHEDLANFDLFTALIPEDEKDEVRKVFDKLLQGISVRHHENHWKTKAGEKRLVSWTNAILHGEDGKAEYIISAGIDVTDQRKAEQGLEVYANELERSNEELENFAYIASHDLQEPLRMIASYLQLLQRRYGDKLDGDADDFINYAVEGAKRMQSLIHGLLEYSRVGTSGGEFIPTDVGQVIDESLRNLTVLIDETDGEIHVEQMPTVLADETQLVQLFQNIIGNALKFHNAKPPRIQISAKRDQGAWVFTITDNGIGIPAKFHQRIFKVFQRLHTQQEYPGTGIGLAVCKRIVERHGGTIWVESAPDGGAQFVFTLPEDRSEVELSQKVNDRFESD